MRLATISLLTERNRLLSTCLLVVGVMAACAGPLLSPSIASKYLKSGGSLAAPTVIEVHILQVLITMLGLLISFYALLRFAKRDVAKKIDEAASFHNIVFAGLSAALLLFSFPFLLYDVVRMGYITPITYNEGWNVVHTSRFLEGKPLYAPVASLPLIPVNYPPLSFLLIGALSRLTGSLLLTGRAVALVSLLLVSVLIAGIIVNLGGKKLSASLGGLLWLTLIVRFADTYVAMDDPQLLGHVFSLGALYFYSRWIDRLTLQKTFLLAFLSCVGIFVKHLLIAVPITLAVTFFLTERRHFWTLAMAGTVLSLLLLLGTWIYAGKDLFKNFMEGYRETSNRLRMAKVTKLFHTQHLSVLFLPLITLLPVWRRKWLFILVYFVVSFLVGAYTAGGVGTDLNLWFDFFIAGVIVFGLLAFELTTLKVRWVRIVAYAALASVLLAFSANFKGKLDRALSYDVLEQEERIYRQDVALLRSIAGPILFEDPLLGFNASKEFLFEPFGGTQMIVSGRVPESILTDPIRRRYFAAIVVDCNYEKVLSSPEKWKPDPLIPRATVTERWTDNTLKAISENYKLLDPRRARFFSFYLPRESIGGKGYSQEAPPARHIENDECRS